jgi:RimJ/RimL family protein N-acetyltransferase
MTATPAPRLETARLVLRGPEPEDLEPFLQFFTSGRAGPNRLDRPDAWRLFATVIGHWHLRGFGCWTVTRRGSDAPIGLVGGLKLENWPEREIGWFLWDGAEGRGYATEAARAALDHAFGALGWPTAVSYIDTDNHRSIRVAERLGAKVDPDADHPGDDPLLVYRHPAPETVP